MGLYKPNLLERTVNIWNERIAGDDTDRLLSITYSYYSYETSTIIFRTQDPNELLSLLIKRRSIGDVIVEIGTVKYLIFKSTFTINSSLDSMVETYRNGMLRAMSELMLSGINDCIKQVKERRT